MTWTWIVTKIRSTGTNWVETVYWHSPVFTSHVVRLGRYMKLQSSKKHKHVNYDLLACFHSVNNISLGFIISPPLTLSLSTMFPRTPEWSIFIRTFSDSSYILTHWTLLEQEHQWIILCFFFYWSNYQFYRNKNALAFKDNLKVLSRWIM